MLYPNLVILRFIRQRPLFYTSTLKALLVTLPSIILTSNFTPTSINTVVSKPAANLLRDNKRKNLRNLPASSIIPHQ